MEYYITSNGELYHHGVKGMKWGVRRYQNPDGSLTAAGKKRVTRYRQREIATVEKHRARQRKMENRWTESDRKYYEKKLAKYGPGDKANKALKYYNARKTSALYSEKVAKAEIAKLRNYKLSDISEEKKAVGKHVAAATIGNIGSIALGVLGAPVVPVYTTRIDAVKTGKRVDAKTQTRLLNEAITEAGDATKKMASSSAKNLGVKTSRKDEADFLSALADEERKKRRHD